MTQNNSPWQYEARTTARQSRWQLARREKRVCCFFLKIDLIYHTPKKKTEYTDTQWQLSPLLLPQQWDLAQLVSQPCLQAEVFVAKNFMNEFTKRFTLPRTSSPSSGTCFSRTNHLWKAHTLTIGFLARKILLRNFHFEGKTLNGPCFPPKETSSSIEFCTTQWTNFRLPPTFFSPHSR